MSHPGGRPLKFKSVEELQTKIDSYFAYCHDKDEVPTISGLAYHLDTTRQTLVNYEEKDGFLDTIKKAKGYIESILESLALMNKVNPTIAIFSMKNNYGWRDKTEVEHSGENPIRVLLEAYGVNNEGGDATETTKSVPESSEGETQP